MTLVHLALFSHAISYDKVTNPSTLVFMMYKHLVSRSIYR